MVWLIALMMMLSGEPGGEVLPPGEIGPVETADRGAPFHRLTFADLHAYQPADDADAPFARLMARVLAGDERARAAQLLRHEEGGYLLIVDAPGAGETWRSGALTWPLLETAHAALGEEARFGVIYRNHAPLLPDYPSFYAPGTER